MDQDQAIQELIKITSSQDIFNFKDKISQTVVESLPENYKKLFNIFSYGTWLEYQHLLSQGDIPPLQNDEQITKLKLLTIVSIASGEPLFRSKHKSLYKTDDAIIPTIETANNTTNKNVYPSVIPYSIFYQELQANSIRELEDLIISAIYADLISGVMDSQNSLLHISNVTSRDCPDLNTEEGKLVFENLSNSISFIFNKNVSVLHDIDKLRASQNNSLSNTIV